MWSPLVLIFFHNEAFACPVKVHLGLIYIFDCVFFFFLFSTAAIGIRSPNSQPSQFSSLIFFSIFSAFLVFLFSFSSLLCQPPQIFDDL